MDALPVILEFVGAGDAFGSGGRLQACLSVRWAGHQVLVDCGATSLVGLKRLGLEPAGVDAVLVSHLHGDHFGGLPFLILDQQFDRRERPLIVGGPMGTAVRLEQALEVLFPGSSRIQRRFRVDVVELQPQVVTDIGPARVLAASVDHASGAPALGLRLQCGPRTLAYSGDTAWTPTLLDLADEADVFVCEAYAFDRPIRYHLDYATLRTNRAQLRCRRLVLTHLGPQALAHRAELETDGVVIADDGLRLEL